MDEVITIADAAAAATAAHATSPPASSSSLLLPSNLPLISAFLAFALAQFLKVFTTWYKEKRWDSKRIVDSGGMPSSHSATVTALAAAIGLQEGTGGPAFAIAVVLACIVMYDASGVRLHAGRQAELLNQIVCEFPPEHPLSNVRPLRELLGHTPLQKINQKNTWQLNLIDHLCEIIKVEEENDVETNFQKASCTLEAGVKIYSLRVDSVHSEAYKVLGGISRAGQENEPDSVAEDANADNGHEEGHSKKDMEKKFSPLSTLESSFEALNVKKFDVAFAVDPLYHQTSAQFDEGGAKGLLLNNLGVYAGCCVLFDSLEVPGKGVSCANQNYESDTIDLSFTREYIEQMVLNMQVKDEISPTLKYIVNQFDEDNKRPSYTFSSGEKFTDQAEPEYNNEVEIDGDAFEDGGTYAFDHDDQPSVVDEDLSVANPTFTSYHEDTEPFSSQDYDIDDRLENVDEYLFLSLGFSSKQNAWAGPDHWKFRKAKGAAAGAEDDPAPENDAAVPTKKTRSKKQAEPDIDFSKALDEELPDLFAPPKNPKSILMPGNRAPCNTTLPEDCHYQPEDLVKLFLLPNAMCLGKRRRRKSSVEPRQETDDFEPSSSWGDGNMFDGPFDDGNDQSDGEDPNTLVSQPRQIHKMEVEYDKTAKQVDVQTLKETIWEQIQESPQMAVQGEKGKVSFRNLLSGFPSDCRAAATIKDISPHLCFICLLHLANEHGLSIRGSPNLDDLSIHLPQNDMPTNKVR